MNFKFSLKDKEATLDADVEKLVEKGMDIRAKNPPRKTRRQIKEEEKRKQMELEQKHFIQNMLLMGGFILFLLVIFALAKLLGVE